MQQILQQNPSTSTMYFTFQQATIQNLEQIFQDCLLFDRQDVPVALLSKHVVNTILLVLTDTFQANKQSSKDEAYAIFQALLGNQWE